MAATPALCKSCKGLGLKFSKFPLKVLDDDAKLANWSQIGEKMLLGTLKELRERKSCPLCSLVLDIVTAEEPELVDRDTNRDPITSRLTKGPVKCWLAWCLKPVLDVATSTPEAFQHRPLFLEIVCSSILHVDTFLFPHADNAIHYGIGKMSHYARDVGTTYSKLNLASFWARTCLASHGTECLPDYPLTSTKQWITFVDVQRRCLVKFRESSFERLRYTVLSYARGRSTFSIENFDDPALRSPEGLSGIVLPKAVKDAMLVTKYIGVKYLWVDCVCLSATELSNKPALVDTIALVFPGAFLAIVALDGPDIYTGFFTDGKPEARRNVRISEELNLVPITIQFPTSPHEKEAWTYQEVVIPKRQLIFSGGLMFFSCRDADWREDLLTEGDPAPGSRLTALFSHWNLEDEINSKYTPEAYDACVSSFTGRTVVDSADVLIAFANLGEAFQNCLGTQVFFGLPVDLMDWALLWQPTSRQIRRPEHPSWSWAGCEGPCELQYFNREATPIFLSGHTWIDYTNMSLSGRRVRNSYRRYLRELLEERIKDSRYDPLSAIKAILGTKELPSKPTEPLRPIPKGTLRFATVSAHFELVAQDGLEDYFVDMGLLIRDKFGKRVGHITLGAAKEKWSPADIPNAPTGVQEILIMSEKHRTHRMGFPDEPDSTMGTKYTDEDGNETMLSKPQHLRYLISATTGDGRAQPPTGRPRPQPRPQASASLPSRPKPKPRNKADASGSDDSDDDKDGYDSPISDYGQEGNGALDEGEDDDEDEDSNDEEDDEEEEEDEEDSDDSADWLDMEEPDEDMFSDPSEWTLYNVMAIRWENGIAQRIGVGWLDREALKYAMEPAPEWKEILLG